MRGFKALAVAAALTFGAVQAQAQDAAAPAAATVEQAAAAPVAETAAPAVNLANMGTAPDATVGQPQGGWHIQPQVTELGQRGSDFNTALLLIMGVITAFVFALLIWLHAPLWRYFAGLIRALANETHRRIVISALVVVSAGYLVMFAIVFDYSRWVSNWAVCMILILHAVKTLPASPDTPLVPTDDTSTTILGAIVTLIPRVGIVRPF